MSGDVSATQTDSKPVQAEAAFFSAFQEPRKVNRKRWLLAALVPAALALVGGWALLRENAVTYRVITPHGIKAVRGGMTAEQVVALLGRPITLEREANGSECYRYGQPTMQQPSFLVYSVCYEGGKLRDVTSRHYSAWQVDPNTGTFVPPAGEAPAGGSQTASESSAG